MTYEDSLRTTADSLRKMVDVLVNWNMLSEEKRAMFRSDLIRDLTVIAEMFDAMAEAEEEAK